MMVECRLCTLALLLADAATAGPAATETALRIFLGTPHATMPNLRLAPEQTDDVITYILSLKGHRPGT